jgi:hypothetical protein
MRSAFVGVLIAAIVACSSPTAPGEPHIQGAITTLQLERETGRFLVEEDPGAPTGKKTWVGLNGETTIRGRSGHSLRSMDLQVGQTVTVWVTGNILDSFPDQAMGWRIVVAGE